MKKERPVELPDEIMGLPSLNLDMCQGAQIPTDIEIEEVMGDIVMIEYVDENDKGEIMRNGIWVSLDVTGRVWRIGRIVKVGDGVRHKLAVGKYVLFPFDRGLAMVSFNGKKYHFMNEERIFAVVKYTPPDESA